MTILGGNRISRRSLLAGAGGSFLASGAPFGAASIGRGSSQAGKPYDLLIKGGKVIDPSQGLEAPRHVAIRQGKIALIAPEIPASDAAEVLPAEGKLVTPGLIDLHTHVFPYVGPYGIEPDPYFVRRGVTTALDAGTSGAFTFQAFRNFVISRAATRIRALLHVVSIGMVAGGTPNMGELEDLRYCDPKLAAQTASDNRDLIVGFKIRFSQQYTGPNDLEGMKRARAAADEAGLPLMTHIGGAYTPPRGLPPFIKKSGGVAPFFHNHPPCLP